MASIKIALRCLECGRTFWRRNLGGRVEVCCPKCRSVDLELCSPPAMPAAKEE